MDHYVKKVWFDEHNIFLLFDDSCELKVSLEEFPRLKNATTEQRNRFELWNNGKWIHWEEIDEDLSAEGFLQYQQRPVSTS